MYKLVKIAVFDGCS